LSNAQLFAILIGLSLLFGGLAFVIYRWCEHAAREHGLIDMVTNY
jgi:hypothetical protein